MMTFDYISVLAHDLMESHDLLSKDWKFSFDNGRRRLGFCNHTKKTISLSKNYIPLLDDEEIIDTLLHEIAHALTGKVHGHDKVWKQKAIEIGCNGERLYHGTAHVKAKYKGMCPKCGRVIYRYMRRKISCSKCSRRFDSSLLFIWELNND